MVVMVRLFGRQLACEKARSAPWLSRRVPKRAPDETSPLAESTKRENSTLSGPHCLVPLSLYRNTSPVGGSIRAVCGRFRNSSPSAKNAPDRNGKQAEPRAAEVDHPCCAWWPVLLQGLHPEPQPGRMVWWWHRMQCRGGIDGVALRRNSIAVLVALGEAEFF
jgi:hypothetical protein